MDFKRQGQFFVSKPAIAHATSPREESTTKLAKFFPNATPVHMPVRLTRVSGSKPFSESTVIEFGTPREVLFASGLPLEFADKLRGTRFYACSGDACDYRFDLIDGPRSTMLQGFSAAWRRFYAALIPTG